MHSCSTISLLLYCSGSAAPKSLVPCPRLHKRPSVASNSVSSTNIAADNVFSYGESESRTTTERFHQWQFDGKRFGVHFATPADATNFANWIKIAQVKKIKIFNISKSSNSNPIDSTVTKPLRCVKNFFRIQK